MISIGFVMEEENNSDTGMVSLIWLWFGFEGWKQLSLGKRIGAQILYRVFFVAGFAACIIFYTTVFGEDPPLAPLVGMLLGWFLFFQALLNFIFVIGSR